MSKKTKVCFVMVDGIGDTSISKLDRKTPLQYAKTPNMDHLATIGLNGLMDPVQPGLACGSDTAHMNIFGYNPKLYYRGRGSFESMGAGIEMKKGDIAFKCNFAVIQNGIVVNRRADRHFEDVGPIFCESLNNIKIPDFPDYQVTVKYATEHRCGIRVRGPDLTDAITDTDPLRDNLKLLECKPKEDTIQSLLTAKLVNSLSTEMQRVLEKHPINEERIKLGKDPANIILFRGCGVRIDVPSFQEKHNMKGFMIAPTAIIKGFGLSLEMDIVESYGGTGDYRTNLEAKEIAFVKAMKTNEYDFGFLHIKAVDDCGHDKNFTLKVEFLEKIDKMIGKLLKELESVNDGDWVVLLTGDHSTPCLYGDHSIEPVPFTICNLQDGPSDKVDAFNEVDAANGELGRFGGIHIFDLIQSLRK